jgi:hypothetical protein
MGPYQNFLTPLPRHSIEQKYSEKYQVRKSYQNLIKTLIRLHLTDILFNTFI